MPGQSVGAASILAAVRLRRGMMTETMDIVLIDDDVSLRRTLRTALETMRHAVAEAATGPQALEAVGKQRFDLAFLDLRLGREKGLDLLPELLRTAPGPERGVDDRVRQHRHGRRGHAPRGVRLPAQAVHAGPDPRRARPLAARVRAAGRGGGPARRRSDEAVPETDLDHGRAGRAGRVRRGLPRRRHRGDDSAPRRERDRQGRPGTGRACPQHRGPAGRSSPSTARACRPSCWRAICSATPRARSPGR